MRRGDLSHEVMDGYPWEDRPDKLNCCPALKAPGGWVAWENSVPYEFHYAMTRAVREAWKEAR